MVTVYTITYNEELLMKFVVDHYRERFPGCRIVVHDNMSTDETVKIATKNGCEVHKFPSGNQFRDRQNMIIKNSCWKDANTDWVLVCDLDELVDINEKQLKEEEKLETSMIKTEVYDLINMENNLDIKNIKYGVKSPMASKQFLFNKKFISEMNYTAGAHGCNPVGKVTYSKNIYPVYHYGALGEDVTINELKERSKRLSQENIVNGWGLYVFMTPEEIRKEYAEERAKATKIR